MDRIVVRGGKALQGSVRVSGAKNSALVIMAATLLAAGRHRITNVPDLRDIGTMRRLLEHFGARISGADVLDIDTRSIAAVDAPYDLVRTMRASFLVLGPLLARYGKARVSLPGGCAIGVRPVDMHIKALMSLGATVAIEEGYVQAECRSLKGGTVLFDLPTVGGTENAMMAAVLADGVTVLENAAREPEIVDLAGALRSMGARIEGDGTSRITIEGVHELQPLRYTVMPDRIEAGTLMAAAAITGGAIRIENCPTASMGSMIEKLRETGLSIEAGPGGVLARGNGDIRPVEITTNPFPGFPTDMQAQIMALLTLARGTSILRETIFENRFIHVAELDRMGANIKVERDTAIVVGTDTLRGAAVMASDLRASASLVLAGLAARGTTVISRVYHLDRGYEHLDRKLQLLGADIIREQEPER